MGVKRLIGGFTPDTLFVTNVNNHYSLPDELSSKADVIWNDLRKIDPEIWNGVVYRLESFKQEEDGYRISLGTLDFKTHRVTSFFLDELEKIPFNLRPNGMYVGSYLRTSDRKFIFGIKNQGGKQRLKFIGGNLNQDEMEILEGKGLFEYFFREFTEETGVKKISISRITGVGIFVMPSSRIGVILCGKLPFTYDYFIKIAKPNFEHDTFIGLTGREILVNPLIDSGIKAVFKYVK